MLAKLLFKNRTLTIHISSNKLFKRLRRCRQLKKKGKGKMCRVEVEWLNRLALSLRLFWYKQFLISKNKSKQLKNCKINKFFKTNNF